MFNFSKVSRPKTNTERLEDEQRRQAQDVANDDSRRRARCTRSVNITLSRDAEYRFTLSGLQSANLCGLQADGKPVRATWYAPDHLSRDDFDAIVDKFIPGAALKLDGYWKPFTSTPRTSFTFIAQFIEVI